MGTAANMDLLAARCPRPGPETSAISCNEATRNKVANSQRNSNDSKFSPDSFQTQTNPYEWQRPSDERLSDDENEQKVAQSLPNTRVLLFNGLAGG
jgi:hypothetical protein